MTQFKKFKVGELISHKKGFAFKSRDYSKKGIPIVRVSDLTEDSVDLSNCLFVSESLLSIYSDYTLEKDDMVITTVGSWQYNPASVVGKVIKVPQGCDGAFLNQNAVRLRANDKAIQTFLFYRMKCDDFKEYIVTGAQGSANQAAITLEQIFGFEFELPEISIQTRIASILSSLDDKIELNRRTNHTLEQIAQTLFKKYFVDDIDPENLPEGWRWGKLEEIISVKHGYAFEGKYFSEDVNGNILLTPGNFKIGGGFNYNKFKYYNGEIPKDYILLKNDLVVTMTDLSKDGDTLGYSALTPVIQGKKILHNQRIGKVLFKESDRLKYFLYWLMRTEDYRSFILGSATGTTVKHTSPTRICEYSCAIPSENILVRFNKVIEELIEKELTNQNEIETLSKVRDSLLPKLMSGEIEVSTTKMELVN